MEIRSAVSEDKPVLLDIWLKSVRATHQFLTEEDIEFFLPLVRDHALEQLELWILLSDEETPMGWMGLSDSKLEAIFLDPSYFRQGGGRQLIEHARRLKGPLLVDVNEQNQQALKFYESLGFVVCGRSETDSSGRAFPLLHLREVRQDNIERDASANQ